jgi:hypothetical protein
VADIQVKRKTSLTLTETFSVDGAPTDLDIAPPTGVPTVVATAPDGTTTAPTASGAWTGRTTGQFRVVLAAQPEVTYRDLTWTGTIGGQAQTLESRVEWIGDLLFTLAQFRALKVAGGTPFASSVTWPDAQILETRAEVLDEFTGILGFSPVPRFHRETLSVPYGGDVLLSELLVTRILSVTAGGIAQVAANFFVDPGGRLLPVSNYLASPWAAYGYGAVVVEYVAGWPRVKGDGSDVAMLRAAMKLSPGLGSTANTVTTPDGGVYTFDPAGQVTRFGNVRHFGVPAIDAWLNRYEQRGIAVA